MTEVVMHPYLTVEEVALLLRKSGKWVYTNKEQIPGYFRLAKSIFFDKETLMSELRTRANQKPARKRPESVHDAHGLLS
jgi:hypothetical protein